jgi:hypothetical protein
MRPMAKGTGSKLLTTKEAAERRRKTPQALVMERKRGEGPPYIIDGGRYLYREDELEHWLDQRRVDPTLVPRRRRRPA